MKIRLAHKGIILVAIPLLFEFLFVGVLALLLAQAEDESARVFHSANIGNCSNKLIKDVFEISAISHSEMLELISSNSYSDRIAMIRADLNDLLEAAKGDPAQQVIVKKSVQAGEEAFMLVDQLRNAFMSGNVLTAMDQLKQSRGELRSCMQRVISTDLLAMAQVERKKAEDAHNRQLIFRRQIKLWLIVGLILNAAITVAVAFIIVKKVVARLGILVDNNFRLVSSLPLHPLIGGSDEIAHLDVTFHDMADGLAEAKQKEKSMIEHSLDLICSLDADGKLTAVNPACERVLGYSKDMLLGANLRSILISEDIQRFNISLASATSGKEETKFEIGIRQKNSEVVDVLWSVHWVESEKSFFCVGHDITARKEMERLKQKFMAMVSHDLRTPLATIVNYMEMLAAGLFGELSEKGKHLLSIAEGNSNRMLSLINDLLDLEKVEFGGLRLDCSPQELNELLDQSIKSVASLASSKEVHLEFSQTDLNVSADPNRISQVLVNLLSNAIKFSPQGGTIKVSAGQSDHMAVIYVADQGRGVPEDMREKIFDSFQQVEIADAVDKGGSGLGLAICKAIVELHGGEIKVQNNNGRGSTFFFTLPLSDKANACIGPVGDL